MRRRNAVLILLTAVLTVLSTAVAGAAPPAISPPTGLTVTAVSSHEALLTWNAVDGAVGYRVLWGVIPVEMIVLDETTQTSYRHSYLAPGATYVYAVQTITRKGVSAPSAVVSVTTPPDPPSFLEAQVIKADEVQLSWTPGYGATSYAVTVVGEDGTETPATVLSSHDRGALVRTVASTTYVFRVRSVANEIPSFEYVTTTVTTPSREPSVINVTSPSPLPAGDAVLTFRLSGTQTLNPLFGTLDVSIDGGPVSQVVVEYSTASLPVSLEPGAHNLDLAYSGDGAFLPSSTQWTVLVAPAVPAFTGEFVVDSSDAYGIAAADVTCDGRTDVVASVSPWGEVARIEVRPGLSDGTFGPTLATPLPLSYGVQYLATGDLDRDGCADLAVELGAELWTFRGTTTGLAAGVRVRGSVVYDVVLEDLTGDGLLDAIIGDGGLSVLPGNGRGGFGRATRLVAAQSGFGVGDLDGDGRLDLVTITQDQLQAWGQSATGQFAVRWSRPLPSWTSITVDDVTGDGRADVVFPANETLEVVSGLDGRTHATVPGVYWAPQQATTGDIDGDGVSDLVSLDGYSGLLGISLVWAGVPTAQQYVWLDPWMSGVRDGGLLVADVTQDGRADVLALDTSGVRVLRQQ